jgi:hypothetical protein
MKNKAILVIILIIIFSVGFLARSRLNRPDDNLSREEPPPIRNLPDNTVTPSKLNPTKDWKTLTNLDHTFRYPAEATAEAREDESLAFFMGQKQIDSGRTQTELFDGYSFRVGEVANDSNLPLEELAEMERESAVNNCHSEDGEVSRLTAVIVSEQEGFQYSATGCYIDYTETIIAHDNIFYRISQSYVGDTEDQDKYEEITNQILSSFQFTE